MVTSGQEYLIALGGNLRSELGVPQQTLRAALERLAELGVQPVGVSSFYRTPCFPPGAGPDYVNAAARVSFAGKPKALLEVLHEVEAGFGRERVQRWGRRTLDLDLIAAGQVVLPDGATHERWRDLLPEAQIEATPDELILPHPRLQDRAFVLVPLADVAPDWVHPVLGRSVAEMVANLPAAEVAEVVALQN